MRRRGARGLAGTVPASRLIAWGTVAWGDAGPRWVARGGEFTAQVASTDPTITLLRLAGKHRGEDLSVVLTPHDSGTLYESRLLRNANPGITGLAIFASGASIGYSVQVWECPGTQTASEPATGGIV